MHEGTLKKVGISISFRPIGYNIAYEQPSAVVKASES